MMISDVQSGGICKIKFEGALLIDAVAQTKSALMAVLAREEAIELDLSKVSECDTAGAQLLLMLRAAMRLRGLAFTTTALPTPVLQLMDSIGVTAEALTGSKG